MRGTKRGTVMWRWSRDNRHERHKRCSAAAARQDGFTVKLSPRSAVSDDQGSTAFLVCANIVMIFHDHLLTFTLLGTG